MGTSPPSPGSAGREHSLAVRRFPALCVRLALPACDRPLRAQPEETWRSRSSCSSRRSAASCARLVRRCPTPRGRAGLGGAAAVRGRWCSPSEPVGCDPRQGRRNGASDQRRATPGSGDVGGPLVESLPTRSCRPPTVSRRPVSLAGQGVSGRAPSVPGGRRRSGMGQAPPRAGLGLRCRTGARLNVRGHNAIGGVNGSVAPYPNRGASQASPPVLHLLTQTGLARHGVPTARFGACPTPAERPPKVEIRAKGAGASARGRRQGRVGLAKRTR